jgi:formylglycine-generating enzyme required for sulfatase activity
MGWDILLGAALEASLGLLAEAGFGDEVRGLKERLTKRGEKARREAFERSYRRAVETAGEENLRPLLEHRPFQEQVIAGLLDPETGFDLQAVAAEQEDGLSPAQTRALRRFFAALENALLADETWGPLLERFQDLRFRRDVSAALQQRRLDVPTVHLVSTVGAQLDGSGAIAQDQGVAATTSGVAVGRDVLGDVMTGIKVTGIDARGQRIKQQFNVAGDVYLGPKPQDPTEALAVYCRVLTQACARLHLRGIDVGVGDPTAGPKPLSLVNVYVNLDTTTQVPSDEAEKESPDRRRLPSEARETRPQSALEATVAHRRLVLLGDPGGGKTTFVNHLTYCLAAHALQPDAGWLAHLPGWPSEEATVLPIPVILRDFVPSSSRAEPCHLWDFITARLEAQNLAFAAAPLHRALEQGRGVILLDGLDEVASPARRAFVRDAVLAFARRYPGNRYLVTCRVLSYQPPTTAGAPDLRLPDFPTRELALLDEEKIEHFIAAWYDELARLGVVRGQDAPGLTRKLREAVRRPDLWRLAPNPLLLTVMALVHTHKGRLPEARALLYEETVDILLWRWEQVKAGEQEGGPRLQQLLLEAGRTDVDLKRVLWRLAYEAHAQEDRDRDREGLADIGELRLIKTLAALKGGDRNWAYQVVEAMKLRAGLLLERAPEVFTFPHRTFQEYLAGAHLAAQADLARRAAALAAEGAAWREVILLAVGRLVYLSGDIDKPLALVGELCPARLADDEVGWRKAWLAGDVLRETGVNRVRDGALGRDLLARVQERLADLLSLGRLSPRERADAGQTLAVLGDPRDLSELVDVPVGPFLMGSSEADEMADDREKPQHELTLPAFKMGKYAVTNAQFAAFVAAGGYEERRYWIEDGWKRKEREGWKGPRDSGTPFNLPNHPVMGVSWYEALAYCRWLTETWRAEGIITPDEVVRLPTEAEWEKAARGSGGRRYPWGDEWDETRCNNGYLDLGTTCAVGIFPGGASPYGCLDMAGNVDEWTSSLWGEDWQEPEFKYPYDPSDGRENLEAGDRVRRVLRGGAFYNNERNTRCSYRYRNFPDYRYVVYGFRVVAAPSPPSPASGDSALGYSGKSALRREA